jgi:hypothetical protein
VSGGYGVKQVLSFVENRNGWRLSLGPKLDGLRCEAADRLSPMHVPIQQVLGYRCKAGVLRDGTGIGDSVALVVPGAAYDDGGNHRGCDLSTAASAEPAGFVPAAVYHVCVARLGPVLPEQGVRRAWDSVSWRPTTWCSRRGLCSIHIRRWLRRYSTA